MEDGKKLSGCSLRALYSCVFCRRRFWHRRSVSTSSIPQCEPTVAIAKLPSTHFTRRRAGSADAALIVPTNASSHRATKYALNQKARDANYHKAAQSQLSRVKASPASTNNTPRKSISSELDSMITDHQRVKGSSTLVRASSGNVMLYANLGNIRGVKNSANSPNRNVLSHSPNATKELSMNGDAKKIYVPNCSMGNIVKNITREPPAELCRALSKRMDPEQLKQMGNEEYKKGRYAEAVALYDRAIAVGPEKALYWGNRGAALMRLGRLLEAVGDCKEAIRIDPSYSRAHHRLATLYLRLGASEKAIHHYKLLQNEANSNEISLAEALHAHIRRCYEARKVKDWHTVLKEARAAVSSGADSAPQVYASQAEALLKLHRHETADSVLANAPKFDGDASINFFGATSNAYFLTIQAQVDMVAGRFEDAVGMAQRAAQLDPSNREISMVSRRTRAAASARSKGNDLFKASNYGEACIAYGEGLDHDPHNAVLLCNRAACRSKLGHWEKAIEDCNTALIVRPSYSKARLRRADCYTKLGRWEAAIQDYEALPHETPGNEEVSKALYEAQAQLKKKRDESAKNTA